MKKLILLVLLLSCSGCGLLAANPGLPQIHTRNYIPACTRVNRITMVILFITRIRIKYRENYEKE